MNDSIYITCSMIVLFERFPAIIHTLLPFYLQEVSIIAFTWDNYKRSITKGDLVQSTAIGK